MSLLLLAEEGGGHPLLFRLVGAWALLLGIFCGAELISKVPPTLHTPLMSGSNAISGITIVGALYCAGTGYPLMGQVLGFFAIAMAMVNVVGGFLRGSRGRVQVEGAEHVPAGPCIIVRR